MCCGLSDIQKDCCPHGNRSGMQNMKIQKAQIYHKVKCITSVQILKQTSLSYHLHEVVELLLNEEMELQDVSCLTEK
jgi:hypothetical protein